MKHYILSLLALLIAPTRQTHGEIASFLQAKYCTALNPDCRCICTQNCASYDCSTVDSATSARVTAIKSLYRMAIDPTADFPVTVASFTDDQREAYRQEFTANQSCALGAPIGWKLALGAASPTNPILGYTEPALGQLLTRMLICSPEARITTHFAVLPLYEVDLFVRVKSEAINQARTPQEIIEAIDLVYPAYELPAGYVGTFTGLFGAGLGGNSVLPMLNGLARLAVLATPIAIPGTRTVQQWVTILSSLTGTEVVTTSSGTITRTFNTNANFLTFALTLVTKVNELGFTIKKGDILSLGNLTGTNQFTQNELELQATYTNLSSEGPVSITLIIDNDHGLCLGTSQPCTT